MSTLRSTVLAFSMACTAQGFAQHSTKINKRKYRFGEKFCDRERAARPPHNSIHLSSEKENLACSTPKFHDAE